jgi:Dicarboxylate transport
VIERIDPSAIAITALDAGETLRVDAIELDLALRRLPALPIERLRLVAAHVDLTGSRSEAGSERTSASSLPLSLLPLLEIEDGRIVLSSAAGPMTIHARSHAAADGQPAALDGTVEGKAVNAAFHAETRLAAGSAVSMTVQVPSFDVERSGARYEGNASGAFEVETAGFDIRSARGRLELGLTNAAGIGRVSSTIPLELSKRDGRWLAKVSDAAIRADHYELDAAGISADASAQSIELRVARLEDTSAKRRFTPLSLHLEWLGAEPEATFTADVSMAGGRATLHGSGSYDGAAGRARSEWKLPRTRLDPQGLRLAELSPLLESTAARGSLEGTAKVEWTTGKAVSASAAVVVDDLSLDAPSVRIDGLTGSVDLAGLFPPATAAAQTLRAREIHPGVALTDATLRWGFEPVEGGRASRLHVERFDTGLADGRLVVEDAHLDPLSATNRIDFHVENADVGRLFEIAGLADTSATGRVSGVIPVVVQDGAVAIPKGSLEAKNGLLQMRSQQAASVLAGGGQSATLLLDVLRDFHYDDLVVTIDKSFTGDASVQVHLEGNNPAVLEGQRFRINLNVSGNLDRLVASLAEVARLSDRAVHATVRGARQEAR